MTPLRSFRSFGLAVAALAGLSCGGDSGTAPDGGGTLVVQMHDAPFNDALAVLVTFSEVSVRSDDGDMEGLAFEGSASRTCDLKRLEDGHNEVLASGSPPEGRYTQIRLVIAGAHLFFESDTQLPACRANPQNPGGRDRAISIPTAVVTLDREFEVRENARTTITLDFDGEKSIFAGGASGLFHLNPVIRVVSIDGP
jgi:hypothetical protein